MSVSQNTFPSAGSMARYLWDASDCCPIAAVHLDRCGCHRPHAVRRHSFAGLARFAVSSGVLLGKRPGGRDGGRIHNSAGGHLITDAMVA
jgi:hypothetical protein